MNIVEVYFKFRSKWKLVLMIEAICIILSIIVILSIPKEYTVNVTLAPETKASTSSYGLASRLIDNLDLSNLSGNGYGQSKDAIYPMIYPIFFESYTYYKNFFNIKVPLEKGDTVNLQYYINNDLKYPWWTNIRKLLVPKKLNRELNQYNDSKFHMSSTDWETIEILQKRITLLIDTKTFVMTIEVTMQDPLIAAIVADSVCNILKSYISTYRKEKAIQNLEDVNSIYKEAEKNYLKTQTKYREFQDTHYGINSYRQKTEGDFLKTQADIAFRIYNQVAWQQQLALTQVEEDRPVFVILNPPVIPNKHSYPSKILFMMGFMLAGGIIIIWYIFKR